MHRNLRGEPNGDQRRTPEALAHRSGVQDAARRELFTEDLLSVPGRLDLLTAHVEALATTQQRTEERLEALAAHVDALAAAQLRAEERLATLAAAQQRTEERLEAL